MVYPKISETLCNRVTCFLLLVNIVLTLTWTQGEATATANEGSSPLSVNNDKLSSPSSMLSSSSTVKLYRQLPKRSLSIPEEAFNRWNLISPSSSSSLDNSPSSSSLSVPAIDSKLTSEFESDFDSSESSIPSSPSDSEFIKRDGSRYAFGLGKRGPYSFGIGKRSPEKSRYFAGKRLPRFQFGLGKKSRYSFGLGKRDLYEYIKRRYNFGIGKRAASQRYSFGLGK